jgi:hypothetical protein
LRGIAKNSASTMANGTPPAGANERWRGSTRHHHLDRCHCRQEGRPEGLSLPAHSVRYSRGQAPRARCSNAPDACRR